MYTDRIDLTLPEANLEQIVSFLLGAEELLASLKSVTPTDRKHLAKLGLKNETLARDIIEVGRANLDLIPRGIDFEKIDRDLIARDQLRSLKFLLERLLGKVKDSLLLTGVDLYAAALSIYHSLKRNGECASLKDVVDELKKGFARPNRKKKGEESERSVAERAAEPEAAVQSESPRKVTSETTPAVTTEPMQRSAPGPEPLTNSPRIHAPVTMPAISTFPAANTFLLDHSPRITISTAATSHFGSIDGQVSAALPILLAKDSISCDHPARRKEL